MLSLPRKGSGSRGQYTLILKKGAFRAFTSATYEMPFLSPIGKLYLLILRLLATSFFTLVVGQCQGQIICITSINDYLVRGGKL